MERGLTVVKKQKKHTRPVINWGNKPAIYPQKFLFSMFLTYDSANCWTVSLGKKPDQQSRLTASTVVVLNRLNIVVF